MRLGRRIFGSGAGALILALSAAGTTFAAVQVVGLSAGRVTAGSVVDLRVAMTAREAGTESRPLFLIPSGTFADGPESLLCGQFGGALEVGQTHWERGTVEYDGATYAGFVGEATFTVPQIAVDTYRLAEEIGSRGTGCHVFAVIEVVAELPDTGLPRVPALTGPLSEVSGVDVTAPFTVVLAIFVLLVVLYSRWRRT